MAVFFRPPGRDTARSVALTPWAQGLLLTTWPGPKAYNFDGATLTPVTLPTLSYLPFGFTAAAEGGTGDVWIAGYFGGVIHIAANGSTTSFPYPDGVFISGAAVVGTHVYLLATTGQVYTVFLATVTPISFSGGFAEEAASLSTDGTLLYATLPTSSNLGIVTLSTPTTGTFTKVATPMLIPAAVTASVSGVAVAGWNHAALVDGATALDVAPNGLQAVAVSSTTGSLYLLDGPDPAWGIAQTISGLSAPAAVQWVSNGEQVMVAESTQVSLYDLNFGTLNAGQTLSVAGVTSIGPISTGTRALACRPGSNLVQVLHNTLNIWSLAETIAVANAPTNIVPITDTEMVCSYAPGGTGGGLDWLHESSGVWSSLSTVTGIGYTISGVAIDQSGTAYTCGTTGSHPTFTGHLSAVSLAGVIGTTSWSGQGLAILWEQGQIAVVDPGP